MTDLSTQVGLTFQIFVYQIQKKDANLQFVETDEVAEDFLAKELEKKH